MMAWVRFTADFSYRKPAFTIAYRKGMVLNVPSEAATLAIAVGKAVRLRKTHKDEEPVEWLQPKSEAPQPDNSASAFTFKSGPSPLTSSATKSAADS